MAIVVSNASIKNDIATLVSHIHICDQPLVKMVHHAAFVTSTEAELFAIRCCYDLKLKGLSNKTTLILSNTRELNRVPSTK